MSEPSKTIIKNREGGVIARIDRRDAVLEGLCEWYDGQRNLLSCGVFHNGRPFAGTFLNWSNFFSEFEKDSPFDPAVYCRDWLSLFEASFRSESPKYEILIEAYFRGAKLIP
jgi:hypothetical protein